MGKKFAKINETGLPVAFYDDTINEIPEDAFEISVENWQECLDNQGHRKFVNGALVEFAPPPSVPTVAQQIAALEATVTPRRIRDAILGTDNGWLANIEQQVQALRATI